MLDNEPMADVLPCFSISTIASVLLTPDLSEPGNARSLPTPHVPLHKD